MPGLPRIVVTAVILLSTTACAGLRRGYAEGRPEMLAPSMPAETGAASGMVRFAFDDLGAMNTDALETHSVPWKVAVAALLMDRRTAGEPIARSPEAVFPILQEYGFILPDTVLNWSGAPYPVQLNAPMGLLRGTVHRTFPKVHLEVASLGCASCHGGVTYDEMGNPLDAVWLGLPNTSLNLGGYTLALTRAFSRAIEHPEALLATIDTLYPAMEADERNTIERHIIPNYRERVPELMEKFGSLTPFHAGGPGTPNAVGSLKRMMGMLEDERDDELSLAQIPDLADRVLRTSLTVDGVYTIPGRPRFAAMTWEDVTDEHLDGLARIANFFTVPAMGARPERLEGAYPQIREVVEFLRQYRPPPFPGAVDKHLALEGRVVYQQTCAECHGTYSSGVRDVRMVSFPNRLVAGPEIATDPVRWQAARPEVLEQFERLDYAKYLQPAPTGGYVAPPLTALWATAPYLHNASVPTLWHLMHAEKRPERFEVGGHRLDYRLMGVDCEPTTEGICRYPLTYQPWTQARVYDTRVPGQSNRGHEREFDGLSELQKRALLEYLKVL